MSKVSFSQTISEILFAIPGLIMILILAESFIFNENYKFKILTFIIMGFSLPIICLFIENMIKKMKGKTIYVKISFLVFFLGVVFLIQKLFRSSTVILTNESLPPCVLVLILSMLFMTVITINLSELKKKEKSSLIL